MQKIIASVCLIWMFVANVSADVMEFRKVDYFEVITKDNGEPDEKKRDARI